MNNDEKNLIEEATPCLSLLDIALIGSHFSRPEDFPESGDGHFTQLEKRAVGFLTQERGDQSVLLVKLELGIRLVDQNDPERVYTQIEADYLAVYHIKSALTDAHYLAFAEFNSLHNVWPFWRQHVYDIVQRGRLPAIDIPLMSGKKLNVDMASPPGESQ